MTQETRSKLEILNEIATSIVSIEEEESKLKNELSNTILGEEKEYGPLAERLVMLEEQYKLFTDLNQELMDIKEKGNIITHEKGNHDRNPTGNSFDKEISQRKELGNHIDKIGTTYMSAQLMQNNPK